MMASSFFFRQLSIALTFLVSLSICVTTVRDIDSKFEPFSKRNSALYDLWKSIPATKKAQGISALEFTIDHSKSDAWGISYLYGCTGIVITDHDFIVLAHILQESGNCVSLEDKAAIQRFIDNNLELALDLHDPSEYTRVQILFNSREASVVGLNIIRGYINDDWGFSDTGNFIMPYQYSGSSGTGEPNPDSPSGLAAVQYIAGAPNPTGLVRGFIGSSGWGENPLFEDKF